jgi:hypothetical protein
MTATSRKRRRWFALCALVAGPFALSWARLLASPMWYFRCETLASPFTSLHCSAPYLFLVGGASLFVVGVVLAVLEFVSVMRSNEQ